MFLDKFCFTFYKFTNNMQIDIDNNNENDYTHYHALSV